MTFSAEAAAMLEYRFTAQFLELADRPDLILRRLFLLVAMDRDVSEVNEVWRRQETPSDATFPTLLRLLELAAFAELLGQDAGPFAERASNLDLDAIVRSLASEYNEAMAIRAAMSAHRYLGDHARVAELRDRLLPYRLGEVSEQSTFECLVLAAERVPESTENLAFSVGRCAFDIVDASSPEMAGSLLVAAAAHIRARGQTLRDLLSGVFRRLDSIVFDEADEPRLTFEEITAHVSDALEVPLAVKGTGVALAGAYSFAPFTHAFWQSVKRHRRRVCKKPIGVRMIMSTEPGVVVPSETVAVLKARAGVAVEQANVSYQCALTRPPEIVVNARGAR